MIAIRQRGIDGKQGEAIGFFGRYTRMRAVLFGKGHRPHAVAPAEQHEVAGIRMFAETHQIFANRIDERMLRTE